MITQTAPTRNDPSSAHGGTSPARPSPQQAETFVNLHGERFQCIEHVEHMAPFFFSLVSPGDHWMFASSNGALAAGRGSPDTALFPYYTVDKITDNWNSTGPQTIIVADGVRWEPFKPYTKLAHSVEQRLLKSINGDTIIFEETNNSLGLRFSYRWQSSEQYGFIRRAELRNLGSSERDIRLVDGLCDLMPAGLDMRTQLHYSCLGDAYKLSELDRQRQLLVHRMASALIDEAVPMECLLATTVWSYGWPESQVLLRHEDAEFFLADSTYTSPDTLRANRGCYLNAGQFTLKAKAGKTWTQVADISQSQEQIARTQAQLGTPEKCWQAVEADIARGKQKLQSLIAASDGQQVSEDEAVTAYHRANVLFNIMRGGVFAHDYDVSRPLLTQYISAHHSQLTAEESNWLNALPDTLPYPELVSRAREEIGEPLARLCQEYLPLTFSRRHGDPSRPWNRFTIRTQDENGQAIVGFQGNWRDIFQNWEALAWSFPQYNEAFLTKFLNATTADGYNPYRITSGGIEWEKPDPSDPWASIGYWGDHQINYLLKLLEFAHDFDADGFTRSLGETRFVFADVPYEIKPFAQLERDPNHSIHFNLERDKRISERVARQGADGKLVHDTKGQLLSASLLEKLLIPLAVKLSNFIPGGGIWMNTQRPEWNDANNALAGHGLSMVTTCYLHRYITFLEKALDGQDGSFTCHAGLSDFLQALGKCFSTPLQSEATTAEATYELVRNLGLAGQQYRERIYRGDFGPRVTLKSSALKALLSNARAHLLGSIRGSLRPDGLYHAYNVLHIDPEQKRIGIEHLDPMLEGQVAALSSGAISTEEAIHVFEAMTKSALYCPKRKSYMLYPDKAMPRMLDTNRVELADARKIPLLAAHIDAGSASILVDSPSEGCLRFHPSLVNRFALITHLDKLAQDASVQAQVKADREAILDLYESTFNHRSFTGRSGSMFAYEGLGSIYWHMVSKLMLAAAELTLQAEDAQTFAQLRTHYYTIQNGLGFRKTPQDYGAFPADAYSHTPAHAGAQQPGLTGMVKEGILCRFAELGVSYRNGEIAFEPRLLRDEEFLSASMPTQVIGPKGVETTVQVPEGGLLFTLAQTPIIYQHTGQAHPNLIVLLSDGSEQKIASAVLPPQLASELILRTGRIQRITLQLPH